jgi:hypothetical protein
LTTLGALLLNPPVVGGTRTVRNLHVAAELLACDDLEIANLFSIPTRDVTAINRLGASWEGWEDAQSALHQLIIRSDHLLAGWGVSGLSGPVARHKQAQVDFVRETAERAGKERIWTLLGEARHPSRWHQYVSDKHGRTSGGSLPERIGAVLKSVSLSTLS